MHLIIRFKSNYGSVTCMNNENICSNIWWFFELHPLLNVDLLFVDFFWISSNLWPNSRFWCWVPYHWNFHDYRLLVTFFHWFNQVQACLYKVPINEDKNLNVFWRKWLSSEQGEEENGLNGGECGIAKCKENWMKLSIHNSKVKELW